ncbi:hypothetical protein HY041_04385 [Candidatus Roizmanbacteria bacterium]|nr:hypothetical protein [Candidatus Roizmanbacteria bacterium]
MKYFIIPTVRPKSPPQLTPIVPSQKISPAKAVPTLIIPTLTLTPTPSKYISPRPTNRPPPQTSTSTSRLSSSKIGIFILSNYSEGAKSIVASGPRVIKVMDPQSNSSLMNAVREYKNRFPQGIVIMRVYEGTPGLRYDLEKDPEESAQNFWQQVLQPAINKMQLSDRQLIDYFAGPNEYENIPGLDSSESSSWSGKFWARLAQIISSNGFKPAVGEIPVGNPDENNLEGFVPALEAIKQTGGVFTYHAYTIKYTKDTGVEYYYSLRYRLFNDWLKQHHPDLINLPTILTEGGVDEVGDPKTSGWQAKGSAQEYQDWLSWYDTQIKNDSSIIGVTLFQIGDGHWSSFNLDPVAGWLSNYLKQ